LLTAIGEFFTARRTTNVPSVVSNAISFDALAFSVGGCVDGQPFAFGEGVAGLELHAPTVSAAAITKATEKRINLRSCALSSSNDRYRHRRHQ
jgi:hypothetical protein